MHARELSLKDPEDRVDATIIPFVLMHVAAVVGPILVGFEVKWVLYTFGIYVVGMFGITAGFHRYFAHRAFKTSRAFQLVLALLGTITVQKGVLWWASHHRIHHRYSDTDKDIHSPVRKGFWWAHVGWFVNRRYDETEWDKIRDFAKYPELVWLNKYFLVVQTAVAIAWLVFAGLPGLVWGFFVGTVVLWHGTFTINSLTHLFGTRRYETTDDSRNHWFFALITLGEGWHNNHHYYQSTANQGFFWWELDVSYYMLKVLSVFGIVWDLRNPPRWVLETRAADAEANGSPEAANPVDVRRAA
ncbi:MAG: acyl-CoA desaturase [Deltaproteobacteria bacterium]|nr:acyl-CoA desaturase [Deltaproteobacteria bacterium]